jgi:hypothetical protein
MNHPVFALLIAGGALVGFHGCPPAGPGSSGGPAATVSPEEARMKESFDFEALKWVTGPLYTWKRDEWLTTTPDVRARLIRSIGAPSWRTSVTATILFGWLENRADYEALLREIDAVDWKKIARNNNGPHGVWDEYMARASNDEAFGNKFLPLAWEALLKRKEEWSMYKFQTFLEIIKGRPDERSIEPLFWYMTNVADDFGDREVAAGVMRFFPVEPVRRRIGKLEADQKDVRTALSRTLPGKYLPAGFEL